MENTKLLQWNLKLNRNLIEWMINDEWYKLSTQSNNKNILLEVDYDDNELINRIVKTCGKIKDEIPLILQFWFKLNYYANQSYIVFKAASLKITYLNGIVQLLSISISNDDIAYLQNMMNVKFANRLKDLYTYNL